MKEDEKVSKKAKIARVRLLENSPKPVRVSVLYQQQLQHLQDVGTDGT